MNFNLLRKRIVIASILLSPITLTSCDEESTKKTINSIIETLLKMLGWNPKDENISDQEDALVYDDDDTEKSLIDLSQYFPPIGDQGEYGTCVAWSSAYALKTSCDAKSNGYTSSQLRSASNQCSPIDLWHLLSSKDKNSGCGGSNFEPALDAMMSKGVDNMANVPFTNSKMVCDNISGHGNSSNKLAGYRVIAYSSEMTSNGSTQGMNVNNFYTYLSKGYPILIGAQLGSNFMEWSNSSTITSDSKDYKGQHAYHALVVTGYDPSRKAFRVRNSWGSSWGDNGCIWVGENFFIKQFVFGAWIAYNTGYEPTSSSISSLKLKSKKASDKDVSVLAYSDKPNNDGTRSLTYDIVNNGSGVLGSSTGLNVAYVLVNEKNINDRVVLFTDNYVDGKSGTRFSQNDYYTNLGVNSGSFAKAQGGNKIKTTYSIPASANGKPVTGKYFIALVSNCFNTFDEASLKNNVKFVTTKNGAAFNIINGEIVNTTDDVCISDRLADSNSYSAEELVDMLTYNLQRGKLVPQTSKLKSSKQHREIIK